MARTHLGKTGIGHVAVAAAGCRHAPQQCQHPFRRVHLRVAQREIEHVFGAALGLHARADFEHAPDPGSPLELPGNGPRHHHARHISTSATTLIPADCSRSMAASGWSKRKISTARSSRPKVNAYMYSMLIAALLEHRQEVCQAAGPVGHFHRHHLRHVHHISRVLQQRRGALCHRHDQAQDAELLGVGQATRCGY